MFLDEREDIFNIIPRVDDHGFMRGLIADDGAITLQRPDRNNFVDHGNIVASTSEIAGRADLKGAWRQAAPCVQLKSIRLSPRIVRKRRCYLPLQGGWVDNTGRAWGGVCGSKI